MRKLLSLPSNLVRYIYDVKNLSPKEYYCTSDPKDMRVGSGGGSLWLLESCYNDDINNHKYSFSEWLSAEKRILLHAGGQSRRLPSYAPSGKILTPVPVYRWERGQKLSQDLLSLQLSLYENIMKKAPENLNTLIASGDVLIRSNNESHDIPDDVDVVCYGMWVEPSLATNHGVFVIDRQDPSVLEYMLQKPSIEELGKLFDKHLFMMDIGIWLLNEKAIQMLNEKSHDDDGNIKYYDLYSDFGLALGNNPRITDPKLNTLKVAIIPLENGEFYHYGTSPELISSTVKVQSLILDQREIIQKGIKPNPSIFVQNSMIDYHFDKNNCNIWIENSFLNSNWSVSVDNIITGVPRNEWKINLKEGVCVDIVPVGDKCFAVRPYGINDKFRGQLLCHDTNYLGQSFEKWCISHGIDVSSVNCYKGINDIYEAEIFPVLENLDDVGNVLSWMIDDKKNDIALNLWKTCKKISADELLDVANVKRLFEQRELFRNCNWYEIAKNYRKSVFYQLDLNDAAINFVNSCIPLPPEIDQETPVMTRIHDTMFRARVAKLSGDISWCNKEKRAFELLKEALLHGALERKNVPSFNVFPDQIVWGRSPVRIDLAGGWTDTPPYSLYAGGNVINIAIELNGQPPLQVYVKPSREKKIILRSIDLGAVEYIDSFEELRDFAKVGSPFSIPKAALALAGFYPDFCGEKYSTLKEQLDDFGAGIELTLLAAIPAGSGLGTSSILASTVLGALSDFCGLMWDKYDICNNTLILEQLLTTGGGWQDQYGGVVHGVKLLQTAPGLDQKPLINWLPEHLFVNPEYRDLHLLYYTGITRTAKSILSEIVSGMFLNDSEKLSVLRDMKSHALEVYKVIQQGNYETFGKMILETWEQNKALDSGTNPKAIEYIISLIKDYAYGYKLPGAGGGGYLYIVAKDRKAVAKIKEILSNCRLNKNARFVDMSLSNLGLKISRS